MLSAVGESAQVALQASTAPPRDKKNSERSLQGAGVKRPRDTVTISPEAVRRTHAALNSTEKSPDRPWQEAENESVGTEDT
ncbi:hypothetical protein [Geomonas sp.]|uniref:hypothetical protein n=1 Tax=Geomonas sp. TaxID=2651584 RepID=UPI002B4A2BEE|nr:hypothetical protein [Geomonas sp.]HJV36877.1 hypothetical protein [Geomonas sp.]